MSLTFGSFRTRLEDMSESDQAALAQSIKDSTDADLVKRHHLRNGAHGFGHMHNHFVLPGNGRDFFEWHRDYLAEMEKRIGRQLPSWRPWNKMPKSFKEPSGERGKVHDPKPPVLETEFLPFSSPLVGFLPNADALGTLLSWGPHFRVHVACGGDMVIFERAPNAPIFWCWHAFIDEIYEDWLRQSDKRAGPTIFKGWPWPTFQPPQHHHDHAVPIPPLYGMKMGEATDTIRDHGFEPGEMRSLSAPHQRIFCQNPIAFTPLPLGSTIDLSGKIETDWMSPF